MPFYKQVLEQYNKINVIEKSRDYFTVLATLVLLIILLLLIFPAIKHITRLNKEITDGRLVKAALEEKVVALGEAGDNLSAIKDDRPLLELALPTGAELGTYLKKVEELAVSKHNLKIAAIQFSNIPLSKPKKEDFLKVTNLSFTLTLEGAFLDFQKFLGDLENYIRTSDVSAATLTKDQVGSLKETLGVTSYYLGVEFVPANKTLSKPAESEVGGAP
ncbi:MAG: hypothetical protein A2126_02485 [Candidatus Woykebacteria bacterium GWB1_45_5]|uniref:Pilus assembly protein PilO n=2 Tax=Candidatus Woykeibacteriota TaxID=1817899 RepID=A0A1G1W0W9_9BACT|nr:MAG: hypothetical protein A2113_00155 [Candidatus Woykebacteria bacterium GWA1_44_8]OGY23688.1 MAG: hypothetical protein A2126_02485 [Candidatus Woykebacteria bacterium GWB1_45_5]